MKGAVAMISFVWTDKNPMYSGRGGTENFTAGQIRELAAMGIESRVITIGQGHVNNSTNFPDITFYDISDIEMLEDLDDTIVFVNVPHAIETKNQSFCIFHCPPRAPIHLRAEYKQAMENKITIVASKFMRNVWANYLGLPLNSVRVVYPFADPHFSKVIRPAPKSELVKVLFAGRLQVEKGVYLYLEAIHQEGLEQGFSFSITTAGNQTDDGKRIEQGLINDPLLNIIDARHNPKEMAELLAQHQIVVMPSNSFYWHEGFGMLSVEAQHAGCQVIASNDGGLPETDCGGLTLFEPGNSMALAEAIQKVAQEKPITFEQQQQRSKFFTRKQSTRALLEVLGLTTS